MRVVDEIVASVVSSSGIPTASGRNELERELRCHLDDVIDEVRRSGCSEEEIEGVVSSRFGDRRAIAQNFAEAYKADRILAQAAFGLGLLLACVLAVTVAISLGQASSAAVSGLSLHRAFSRIPWELCGVGALTLGYLGTYVLQVRLRRWNIARTLPVVLAGICVLYLAINLLPPSHRLGPAVAFLCASCARLLQPVTPRWVAIFGSIVPLIFAWVIRGPLTGNGRLGPWEMLTLACFNLIVACEVLGWIVGRCDRWNWLRITYQEPIEL